MSKIFVGSPRERTDIPACRDCYEGVLSRLFGNGLYGGHSSVVKLPVALARNLLAKKFLETEAGHLFFLDSDMTVHPDTAVTLYRRMERHPEIGVLSAATFKASVRKPHPTFCNRTGERGISEGFERIEAEVLDLELDSILGFYKSHPEIAANNEDFYCYPEIKDGKCLFQRDRVGGAATMVRRAVFEKILPPWFENDPWGSGEDWIFCDKAKAEGFGVYVDLSVMAGHVCNFAVTHRDLIRFAFKGMLTENGIIGKS